MSLDRIIRSVVGLAITAAVLFVVWYFSAIVIYILVAAVLAVVFRPMVSLLLKFRIRSWHMPQWMAATLTLFSIWALFALIFTVFVPLIFSQFNELSTLDFNSIFKSLEEPLKEVQHRMNMFLATPQSDVSLKDSFVQAASQFFNFSTLNSAFSSVLSTAVSFIIALFSISFITFFFLKDAGLFETMVASLFPERYYDNVIHALDSVTKLLYRYFVGLMTESLIIMVFVSVSLIVLGMSSSQAIFIGAITGTLNVIPYAGPVLACVISLFLGIIEPIEGQTVLYTILSIGGTWLAIKGVDDFIVQPALYSERVKAHPLEIFIVILIAGYVAGIVGMLLAIPSYTVLRVFAKEFFSQVSLVRKLTKEI